MAKKPFTKPQIVRRKERLATVVQFTSGGNYRDRDKRGKKRGEKR